MWRRSLARLAAVAAVVAPLALTACNPDKLASGNGGDQLGEFAVTANVIGTPIATLVVTVTAADIATPLVFNLTVHDGSATGTIKIPPGAARLIAVEAFDSNGDVTHEGHKTIDVRPGQNPPVNIPMVARSGHVEITVQLGAVSVVVNPSELTTYVDGTAHLSAVITAPNGDVLSDANPEWATSNPTIASVDESGNVSGVREGTVDIVATYAGIAGISHVTVQPSCVGCNWTTARVQLFSPPFRGNISGLWGTSGTNVYAATNEGDILRYTGSGWNVVFSAPFTFFTAISGASSSDIWAVGYNTYHFDGSSWTQKEPLPQGATSVFATSNGAPPGTSVVYVTSYDSRIFVRSGTSWNTDYTDPSGNYFLAIWGSSATDIFAAGSNGAIVHYDGNAWVPMVSGTTNYIYSLWGTGPSNVYAAAGNIVLHYNGTSWSPVSAGVYAYAVTGNGANDVYAVGGQLSHFDGISWTTIPAPSGWSPQAYLAWGGSASGVFLAGYPGASARYRDGAFTNLSLNPNISGLSVVSKTLAYAVGDAGLVYKFNGTSWAVLDGPTNTYNSDIFATADNNVLVLNCSIVRRFNGASWTSETVSPSQCQYYIAGSSASNIFTVGNAGTIYRYDGTSWSPMASGLPSSSYLTSIWTSGPNDAYAAATSYSSGSSTGTLLHYDGFSWSPVGTPFSADAYLNSVSGTGPNDVYVAGYETTSGGYRVAHFDGSSWSFMPNPSNGYGFSVFASRSSDVYLAGYDYSAGMNAVFRWNGSSWQTKTTTSSYLGKLAGKAGVDVFAVGGSATIMHGNSTVTSSVLASLKAPGSNLRVPPPIVGRHRVLSRELSPRERLVEQLQKQMQR